MSRVATPIARVLRAVARTGSVAAAPIRFASTYRSSGAPKGRQFFGIYFARQSGCINMRVIQPVFKGRDIEAGSFHLARQGAVSLEIAPSLDADAAAGDSKAARGAGFDWANKIIYRLSAADIAYLASLPPTQEAQLSQTMSTQSGSQTRSLSIALDKSKGAGVYCVSATQGGENVASRRTQVWLSPVDLALLKHLLNQSLSTITGWAINLDPTLFDASQHMARDGYDGGGGGDAPAS